MNMKKRIFELIDTIDDDQALAAELGKLRLDESWTFDRFVSSWGRKLYERNRRVFLPLIQRSANSWTLRGGPDLKGWMEQAEANGDRELFRKLLEAWLPEEHGWGKAAEKWEEMLRDAFRAAETRADRRDVIEKYDLWFDITDELATALYRVDPVVTAPWVIDRLKQLEWYDIVYENTARVALESGDRDFYFELYRRTFTRDMWASDVEEILENVTDPTELCAELDRRHLIGEDTALLPDDYLKLLEARGGDVMPYLLKHIPNTRTWAYVAPAWKKILSVAGDREWWHLWTTVVKSQSNASLFTESVQWLLDSDLPEWRVASLLAQIAGATYGWEEWQQPAPLTESTAIDLYERFPEFVRGPFGFHLVMRRTWDPATRGWEESRYLDLAQRAVANDDHVVIDILAAKGVEQSGNLWQREPPTGLDWYVQYYASLGDDAFAARAFGVLERLPEFEFLGRELRRGKNDLYGIFFDEPRRYRSRVADVGDLLESANEDVRRLALQIVQNADHQAAVAAAEENVGHLLAYLLNESTRATRIAAFDVLAMASERSEEIARRVVSRARAAFRLRRKDYPRDRLIELVGKVIHRWPSLRGAPEEPVIYDHAEAS